METSDLLRAAGEALYGAYGWQSELARQLEVPLRSMQRYAAGGTTPDALLPQIKRMVLARQKEIDAVLRKFEKAEV